MSDYSMAVHPAHGALAMRLAEVTADEGDGWTTHFRSQLAKIKADETHPLHDVEVDPFMLIWWLCKGLQDYAATAAAVPELATPDNFLMGRATMLEISALGA